MESISSDDSVEQYHSADSSDSEMKKMKDQLTEFGLQEENLSKEEMIDLLKALNNSKASVTEDELLREKDAGEHIDKECDVKPKPMKRRYLNVKDRRMPWSVLPSTITQAEKARTLAVYIKLMSISNYRQARLSANFASWPPPIQIVEESSRVQPLRSTRSGRSVPIYTGFDDDDSDLDFIITKTKKRKILSSDQNSDTNTGKVISLKRKPSKDENARPIKEPKLVFECSTDVESSIDNAESQKDIFTLIEN